VLLTQLGFNDFAMPAMRSFLSMILDVKSNTPGGRSIAPTKSKIS